VVDKLKKGNFQSEITQTVEPVTLEVLDFLETV